MHSSRTKDLAALCWANPFSEQRGIIEMRLLGEAYKPVVQAGGGGIFSPNLSYILKSCSEALERGNTFPEYEELVAFEIYHSLGNDFDELITHPGKTPLVWNRYIKQWNRFFPDPAYQPAGFDRETLFALFFQIRRAFHWIFNYVIGSSEEAIRLRSRIWESIFSHDLHRYVSGFHKEMNSVHTLITGPSGTGKSLVAKAIGMSRFIPFDTATRRFVSNPEESWFPVNIAVLPELLLESTLFGHAKGSFTGAYSDQAGLFESAGVHGVLFLDEIGDASSAAQAKLLTVLQDRKFQRVGETHSRTALCRVITATNRNLEQAVVEKQFRQDLYFRLSADRIETVPLRKLTGGRTDSLKPMVIFITSKLLGASWTPDVVDTALQFIDDRLGPDYQWPGNFRELEQCLRNFLIHRDYAPVRFEGNADGTLEELLVARKPGADQLLGMYAKALYRESGSYKAVGKILGVDQRTAKKYVDQKG